MQFLQQINVKKMSCPSSIWRWDLNPRPLEYESSHITTRPGLPPTFISLFVSVPSLFSSSIISKHQNCFINSQETQWNHPDYVKLLTTLLELNVIKYSAYRLASKLRAIQRKLRLDLLDIEVAHRGFEEHGLTAERHEVG